MTDRDIILDYIKRAELANATDLNDLTLELRKKFPLNQQWEWFWLPSGTHYCCRTCRLPIKTKIVVGKYNNLQMLICTCIDCTIQDLLPSNKNIVEAMFVEEPAQKEEPNWFLMRDGSCYFCGNTEECKHVSNIF